jgi:dCTP deaminase
MSAVSDSDFKKLNINLVEPFDPKRLQPSSYDLTLDGIFLKPIPGKSIDLRVDDPRLALERIESNEYVMKPGACLLGSTIEIVRCPNNLTARVDGKSSIGRLFLAIHVTAGVIDAGWEGQITLEIVNHGPWDITLWKGMPIAQLSYFELNRECETPYGSKALGSHYHGQRGPTSAVGKRALENE